MFTLIDVTFTCTFLHIKFLHGVSCLCLRKDLYCKFSMSQWLQANTCDAVRSSVFFTQKYCDTCSLLFIVLKGLQCRLCSIPQ